MSNLTNQVEAYKLTFFVILLSTLVYSVAGYNYFLTNGQRSIIKLVVLIIVYLVYLKAEKSDPSGQFEKVVYGFFTVSVGFFAAWYLRGLPLLIPGIVPDSVTDWAISKFGEALPICIAIIVLNLRKGESFSSLGLSGGNIRKSLGFGLVASLLGFVQYFAMVGLTIPPFAHIIEWLPWLVLFGFSNSFMEELMFRGLFLEKYGELFGEKWALLLISSLFAVFHVALLPFMGLSVMVVFVVFLFFQGYAWGYTIQRSGSIWGAVLAHALADILFVIAAFSVYN
jgi:membrane protease YdiL (CAAX protease family)